MHSTHKTIPIRKSEIMNMTFGIGTENFKNTHTFFLLLTFYIVLLCFMKGEIETCLNFFLFFLFERKWNFWFLYEKKRKAKTNKWH